MTITTPEWVKDAVFYQIFPDRFARSERLTKPANLEGWDVPPTRRGFKGGDFQGMLEHLDYLEDLGITAIYFNPIFQSPANHRYHTHDYFHVDMILGGAQAFRAFLDAAHARGIRVILDAVFNHTGRGFFAFDHILENGPQSPYLDWYTVKEFPLRAFDSRRKPNYECWWNKRELPKLNTDNPRVRAYLYEVAEYWLNQGIDGWRLDVPQEITTPGFWEEFRKRVKAINPEAYIVGEIWRDAVPWLQGNHFDAVMNYGFNRACTGFFGGEALDRKFRPGGFKLRRLDARRFGREIDRLLNLYDWEVTLVQYNLLSSHDEPRFLTVVGNDKRRLRLATLFQMTFPGAPSIYYGDEIGMTGGPDPDCRRAFPWSETLWDHDLREDFKRFIALRRAHPALRRGDFITLYAKGQSYGYARRDERETFVVLLNAGTQADAIEVDLGNLLPPDATVHDVWSQESVSLTGTKLSYTLPPLSSCVLLSTSPSQGV